MALQGFTISGLPAVGTPAAELPGALFEVEVPVGPVAGGYVNKKLTTEQYVAYLLQETSFVALLATKADATSLPQFYDQLSAFPSPGVVDVVYVARGARKFYQWTADGYAELSPAPVVSFATLTGNPTDNQPLADALAAKADLVGGVVPASQLPSYVDDVLEYDTVAQLPATGEKGKIYVITTGADANTEYRWSGSQYVQLVKSPGSTDALPEGSTNYYFTFARSLATKLTGYAKAAAARAIDVTDTALIALGLLEKKADDNAAAILLRAFRIDKEVALTVDPNGPASLVLTTDQYNQKVSVEGADASNPGKQRQLSITLPPVGTNVKGTRLALNVKYALVSSAPATGANVTTASVGSPDATDYTTLLYEMGSSVTVANRAAWILLGKLAPGGTGTSYDDTAVKASIELLRARFAGQNRGPWTANTAYNQYDFVTNNGTQYYAPQAFTSGDTFNAANWVAAPYAQSGPYQYIGPTADDNLGLLGYSSQNTIGAGSKGNRILRLGRNITLATACIGNVLACNGTINLGTSSSYNVAEAGSGGFVLGTNCLGNRKEINTGTFTAGNSVVGCRILAGTGNVAFGDNCSFCVAGKGSDGVNFGAGCQRVEVYNTQGTQDNPFVVPAGTTDAVYVAGVLQTGSGGSAGTLATGTYTAQAAGAQAITVAGATAFLDVNLRATNGQAYALSNGTGYTVSGNTLSILAAANVQAGGIVEYAYLTGSAPGAGGGQTYTGDERTVHISSANVISTIPRTVFFKVTGGYNSGGGIDGSMHLESSSDANGRGFQTVPLTVVQTDIRPAGVGNGWNAGDNTYTIQEDGLYELIGKFRVADANSGTPTPPGKGYGIGVNVSNSDNSDFAWFQANNQRNSSQNNTSRYCLAGEKIRLYVYLDGFGTDCGGMFSVRKLG